MPSLGWTSFYLMTVAMFAAVAMAQGSPDSATGTLQVAKESFALKHAFAVMEEDPFSGGEKDKLTVLLTDVPVPTELRKASSEWRIWVADRASAGAIHGLILSIDPETKVWDSGQILTKGGFMFYSESVSGGAARNLNLEATEPVGDHAAGKLSMKNPMSGMSDDDGPWSVDAQFRAAVARRPKVTATLAGPAALDSAPYKAAKAFLDACRKKDVDAIRAAIDPASRSAMMEMFSGPGKDDALNMFSQMAADTLTFKLTRITVHGDVAELEFRDPKPDSGSSQKLRVVLAAGEWKIAR